MSRRDSDQWTKPPILVCAGNDPEVEALRSRVEFIAPVEIARSSDEAEAKLEGPEAYSGAILDDSLPGKTLVEVGAIARRARPELPILVILGERGRGDVRGLVVHGLAVAMRPDIWPDLDAFLRDVVLATLIKDHGRRAFVLDRMRRFHLSAKETEIVVLASMRLDYGEIAAAAHVSISTVRTHAEAILRKCGMKGTSVHTAASVVLSVPGLRISMRPSSRATSPCTDFIG